MNATTGTAFRVRVWIRAGDCWCTSVRFWQLEIPGSPVITVEDHMQQVAIAHRNAWTSSMSEHATFAGIDLKRTFDPDSARIWHTTDPGPGLTPGGMLPSQVSGLFRIDLNADPPTKPLRFYVPGVPLLKCDTPPTQLGPFWQFTYTTLANFYLNGFSTSHAFTTVNWKHRPASRGLLNSTTMTGWRPCREFGTQHRRRSGRTGVKPPWL